MCCLPVFWSRLANKTVILAVDFHGPLTLREEHRLRVFENRVLSKIFGPKRVKMAKERRDCVKMSFTCL
jgi:hypothetical protein